MHRREIRSYFLWIEILKTVCWRKRAELPLFSFLLCGIAVLPCFSASGKVPVTRCGLPLRGTYAAYVVVLPLRLSHAAYRPRLRNSGAVFSDHFHFHVSHNDNGLTLSGRYPASGRDGWESNPPKRFWRPPRQPWNIRPCIPRLRIRHGASSAF